MENHVQHVLWFHNKAYMYCLLAGIQRHFKMKATNINHLFKYLLFFFYASFELRGMKDLRVKCVGLKMQQDEPITGVEEIKLWDLNILGDISQWHLCTDYSLYMYCEAEVCIKVLVPINSS